VPTPGDFDGDGKGDFAVFRPSDGLWYISQSSSGTVQYVRWGVDGDVPAVGDYDGDGKDDVAIYRPSSGVWYVVRSTNGTYFATPFGIGEDLPVPKYDQP
jgi:hypothetical protein